MNDWQYLSLGYLEQNNFPQIKSWGFLVAEYPGSRDPFSKYLVGNKPCLRFDKAPETTSGHTSKQPNFHARNQFRIWTGSPIGYSHVRRELTL